MAHLKRSKGLNATEVLFDSQTPFKSNKDVFLTNARNKQRFINLLGQNLENSGCDVLHAKGDADLRIVQTAIALSSTKSVFVVGSDTDLLVLLTHCCNTSLYDIYFGDNSKAELKCKIWDIKKTRNVIGNDVADLLPAIHALTGCDTTSRMFGVGKAAALKKLKVSEYYKENLRIVSCLASSKEQLLNAGSEIVSCLYGGHPNEGLDFLRYRKFGTKLAAGSIAIQCQNLPPTSDAASFHILRAFHQTHYWLGGTELPATDWGWYLSSGNLYPIKTSKAPAPSSLIKMIRCQCKSSCDNHRCTCRKNGLECSISCSECHGSCSNSLNIDIPEDEI